MFVNEYGVLGSGDYGNWYFDHIEQLRQAGITAGYGDVLGGIGVQHYPGGSQNAGNIMRTLQNLSVQGLPIALTEFGVSSGVSDDRGQHSGRHPAAHLRHGGHHRLLHVGIPPGKRRRSHDAVRPVGRALHGQHERFQQLDDYRAGKKWQDLLGIADWDGNPNNGWTTQLTAIVDENGTINFNGFWGDYELTIGGQTIPLTLSEGRGSHTRSLLRRAISTATARSTQPTMSCGGALTDQSPIFAPMETATAASTTPTIQVWRAHFGTITLSACLESQRCRSRSAAILLLIAALTFRLSPWERRRAIGAVRGFSAAAPNPSPARFLATSPGGRGYGSAHLDFYFDDNGMSIVLLPDSHVEFQAGRVRCRCIFREFATWPPHSFARRAARRADRAP